MKIKVKIYSCYQLTYSRIYQDVLRRLYGSALDWKSVELEIEDISENGTLSIQSQRSNKKYVTRTIRVYENDILKHIVGISNTNYDYDKDQEFKAGKSPKEKNAFGGDGYHANSYLFQGCNNIFNYYYSHKETCDDLTFYLLDTHRSYPHNLYNILSYRELETVGFKILNIDMIDLSFYEKSCNSNLSHQHLAFHSFDKLMRDIAYISKQNKANFSSFLKCDEIVNTDSDGNYTYTVEKYIYTFKSLSAHGYESLLRCWCMKVLAEKEHVDIEFRLGKQYFAFKEKEKRTAEKLTKPIEKTLAYAGIDITYVTDETFMNEISKEDDVYARYKAKNILRNQALFRNNIRKKGIPKECVLCGEENPAIVDAAHLWEVSKIKQASNIEINNFIHNNDLFDLIDQNSKYKNELFFKKYSLANSGENGVWLCKNHHGLFDDNYFCFDSDTGRVLLHFDDAKMARDFAKDFKSEFILPSSIFTVATKAFLVKRQICFSA